MIAVDSNVLVYAHREESPFHAEASRQLIELAARGTAWAIPWPCMHEFLSVVTNPRIYRPATSPGEAVAFCDALLESPDLNLIAETERHWDELRDIVSGSRVVGALVHDARIAAICLQHGVSELWSADRDFSRFPQLKVVNPLVGR